jgi:hypothetical protein
MHACRKVRDVTIFYYIHRLLYLTLCKLASYVFTIFKKVTVNTKQLVACKANCSTSCLTYCARMYNRSRK